MKATNSLFTGLAQAVVAAFKKRKVTLPRDDDSDVVYYSKTGGEIVVLTDKLRFLNKGCVVSNPEKDISADGTAVDPWSLCTIEQVEALKALLKVLPVWSTGMLMSINVSQTSFPVLQASSMDRHIAPGSSFQIPAGSFYVFLVIAITVWVILYDRVIIPAASKLSGKPVRLGVMARMGIGISISTLAMVVSAIVEHVRRGRAMREGLADDPRAVVHMSAMWLVPQYCLQGLAEAFNAIGQTEFYYTEFPKSMSSIAACLSGLGMAVANVLAIPIVNAVDKITSRGGKPSWVSNNINRGHYDKYYWLLAFISFANIFYFLACSWAYGPLTERGTKDQRSQESRPTPIKEQEMGKQEKV
ncbi:hypothetical protein MLD38_004876 [Melastoma candidum]|nr:hypothetical protein MLD38_004876 [Melastoma candidum]